MVVASLPWGRQQRIPHAAYLPEMLRSLALQLPGCTFVLLSADPASEMLARYVGRLTNLLALLTNH